MKQKELSEPAEQERSDKAKKAKSASITNAVLIGVMIGIFIYSIAKNGFGFLALIPLFLAYLFLNNSKNTSEPKEELKEGSLK